MGFFYRLITLRLIEKSRYKNIPVEITSIFNEEKAYRSPNSVKQRVYLIESQSGTVAKRAYEICYSKRRHSYEVVWCLGL